MSSNMFEVHSILSIRSMLLCTVLPSGCANVQGPYSLNCLQSTWYEAGCLIEGRKSPHNLTLVELEEYQQMSFQ